MATEVAMPQMGYDMTEGTVVKWLKKEGDEVKRSEAIAEIETDKATVEMEAERGGILRRILVQEGDRVPVGQILAYIGSADEDIPDAAPGKSVDGAGQSEQAKPAAEATEVPAKTAEQPREQPAQGAEPAAPPADPAPSGSTMKASPIARRLADEHGVDLRQVSGSGPGGRITKDDVLAIAKRAPSEPAAPPEQQPAAPTTAPTPAAEPAPPGTRTGFPPRVPGRDGKIPVGKMGQAIARRTQQTMQEAPLFYLTASIDMTRSLELRQELNASLNGDGSVRVSVNDLIVKACATALQKYPVFNSSFEGDHLKVNPHVNVGIAVALPEGLVVPAVLECEKKSLVQIARETRDVAERAKSGHLRQEEYTGTFSVSNLGMFNVDEFTAIIVSPQVAVLAIGAVQPKPVVRDGEVVVRQMMSVTLSTDHRAANGAESAQFTGEVKRLLENPLLLLAS